MPPKSILTIVVVQLLNNLVVIRQVYSDIVRIKVSSKKGNLVSSIHS